MRQRIAELSESLSELRVPPAKRPSSGVQSTSLSRLGDVEMLNERLTRFQATEQTRLSALHHELTQTQAILEEERAACAALPEKTRAEVELVEGRIHQEIWEGRRESHESAERLLKEVDERCFAIRLELAMAKRLRQETEERVASDSAQESAALSEAIATERRAREHRWQRFEVEQQEELSRVRNALEHERQQREQSERELIHSIDDLYTCLRSEIALEKRDREATESMILRLLEKRDTAAQTPKRGLTKGEHRDT